MIRWNILEKDIVDEVIFRIVKSRNRLMLELMARGGMRISEVLQLTPSDIDDRKFNAQKPPLAMARYLANRKTTKETRKGLYLIFKP